MKRTVLYPGSFDPVTIGHMDVLRQTLEFADIVVIAIGLHHEKSALLDYDKRFELIELAVSKVFSLENAERIKIVPFGGLVVDAAQENNASLLVRGLRNGTDFDYEMQMVGMNSAMASRLQTVFVPASKDVRHISSSLVRQVAKMGGDVSKFVPEGTAEWLNSELEF